jgi:hypothetical protein
MLFQCSLCRNVVLGVMVVKLIRSYKSNKGYIGLELCFIGIRG